MIGMLVCVEMCFVYGWIFVLHVWVLSPGMFDPQQFLFNLGIV